MATPSIADSASVLNRALRFQVGLKEKREIRPEHLISDLLETPRSMSFRETNITLSEYVRRIKGPVMGGNVLAAALDPVPQFRTNFPGGRRQAETLFRFWLENVAVPITDIHACDLCSGNYWLPPKAKLEIADLMQKEPLATDIDNLLQQCKALIAFIAQRRGDISYPAFGVDISLGVNSLSHDEEEAAYRKVLVNYLCEQGLFYIIEKQGKLIYNLRREAVLHLSQLPTAGIVLSTLRASGGSRKFARVADDILRMVTPLVNPDQRHILPLAQLRTYLDPVAKLFLSPTLLETVVDMIVGLGELPIARGLYRKRTHETLPVEMVALASVIMMSHLRRCTAITFDGGWWEEDLAGSGAITYDILSDREITALAHYASFATNLEHDTRDHHFTSAQLPSQFMKEVNKLRELFKLKEFREMASAA